VWAALFRPAVPNAERAAVVHVHGGGYRQFAHNGWSVYGYHSHVGLINYLLQRGYTVLDFDYRGGAGFGRDYRTDVYRSMGIKDVDGAIGAIDYLAKEHGVDRARVGVYGVSYGGFFTLMALFRHPGLFAAGVANAAVSDWAHYNESFTAPILNRPAEDPEAYRVSSPIYHAAGLRDPLLIVHGLIDDNVHFQDAARVVQRLIELEKPFEVMYYPGERHQIATEASRLDFNRRVVAFFARHLLGAGAERRKPDVGRGRSP
jgi:dipeptidyl aminopeptidase/acylaminoacyl peptidase